MSIVLGRILSVVAFQPVGTRPKPDFPAITIESMASVQEPLLTQLQFPTSDNKVDAATPAKRRGKSMSRRAGQKGQIVVSGKWYRVRFRMDVEGQEERRNMSERICPTSGPGLLSKSKRERKAREIIVASGADTVEHFNKVVKQETGVRFREQAKLFLQNAQTKKRNPIAPSTVETWQGCFDKHLDHELGDMFVSEVDNDTVKPLVDKLAEAGLKPKTISNYLGLVRLVVASAKDGKGRKLYSREWDYEFMDVPLVEKERQNAPSFAGETVTALVVTEKNPIVQMLYILLAATGLRLGEALGITISKDTILDDCTRIVIKQKAWRNEIQGFLKTKNGGREVDLHPSVAFALKEFIGNRTSGLLFQTKGGKPLCQTNLLKRYLHPALLGDEKKGIKGISGVKAGFHAFRRFRNTYLRNYTACPEGVYKFWMGHAGKDMSDLYDKIKVDVRFRKEISGRVGIGFELASIAPSAPNFVEEIGEEVLV
jgi:integrase